MAALLLGTACHYVDPQCMAADLGLSGQRAHGTVLELTMLLPHKRHTHFLYLSVDGAGGVSYRDSGDDVTTCRRMSEDEKEGLAQSWSSETLAMSMPLCGPGYVFHRPDDRHSCRENWSRLAERRREGLPFAHVFHDPPNEERVSFGWDMDSPLPEEIEMAFTGTLGLLCAESRRLATNLRRRVPELAARAGC